MKTPEYVSDTLALAKRDPLWGAAFVACALLPWALIFSRAGAEVACGIIGLTFLWRSFKSSQWSWLREPFTVASIVAWAWILLIVTPLSIKPETGVVEAALWFRMPLMFASLRYFVLKPPSARTLLVAWLACMLSLVVVDSLWQLVTGVSFTGNGRVPDTGRLTGPFDKPKVGIFMAKLLLPCVGIALVAALQHRRKRWAVASVALLIISIITIVFTGERAAFITSVLGCGVVALLLMMTEKRLRVPFILAGALGLLGVIGLYYGSAWVHFRGDQMLEVLRHYPESDYGLLMLTAIDMGREHWLHGVGILGFYDQCPELPYHGITFRGLHPHNVFAEWFSEAGLPGLLLFVTMLGILVREAVRSMRGTAGLSRFLPALALGAMAQHFFPLMGMQSFFSNWSALLLWYSLSLVFAALPARAA